MTPGEETERTGEGRTVLEDTSRVGDVTGKKTAKWESLGVLVPKEMWRQEEADGGRSSTSSPRIKPVKYVNPGRSLVTLLIIYSIH